MDIKSFWPELGPSIQEASVYFDKYKNKKIILKYGGQVMSDQSLSKAFAQDAAILRKLDVDVAVIHGYSRWRSSNQNKTRISKFGK